MSVTAALLATGAGAASAAVWNAPGLIKFNGTLTVSAPSYGTRTCAIAGQGSASNATGFATITGGSASFKAPCNIASSLTMKAEAYSSGGVHGLAISNSWCDPSMFVTSPFGSSWVQSCLIFAPFTNASGGNPSRITLSTTQIGSFSDGFQFGNAVHATGTINLTTGAGGALTLS